MELSKILIVSVISSTLPAILINFVYACTMLHKLRAEYPQLKHPPFWRDFWRTFFGTKE